jgi:hypothetical protein
LLHYMCLAEWTMKSYRRLRKKETRKNLFECFVNEMKFIYSLYKFAFMGFTNLWLLCLYYVYKSFSDYH